MYRLRLITLAEKEAYRQFSEQAPYQHILQTWEWGEVKGEGAWRPYRFLVENKAGEPLMGISILARPIPFLGKLIFYAPRGPIGDLTNWPVLDFLFEQLTQFAREKGAIFLKIDPAVPQEDQAWQEYLQTRGFVPTRQKGGFEGLQPKYVFRLDLSPDCETLLANFHAKTRYNIRLAGRRGVEIKEDCSLEDLPVFYNLLVETTERDKFLVRPYQYFEEMWSFLEPAGYLKLFLAYYQGEPIAGTLAYLLGETAWYIYGASANENRQVMPNYLLQWTMIKWAKENKCRLYDFRGVSGDLSPDNPLYGLYRFKKGFQGDFTEFAGESDLVFAPFYYRLWTNLEPFYQKNIRRWLNFKKVLKGERGD